MKKINLFMVAHSPDKATFRQVQQSYVRDQQADPEFLFLASLVYHPVPLL